MNENSQIDAQWKAIKNWLSHRPCFAPSIIGCCLGIICTIFFGPRIEVSDLPDFLKPIVIRNQFNYDMSGDYYYVITPQKTPEIYSVRCDISGTKAIVGSVEIRHKSTIINPSLLFVNGERRRCLSNKGNTVTLSPVVNWESKWAFITDDGDIFALVETGDRIESLLQGKISSNSGNDYFNVKTLYIVTDKKTVEPTNIKFSKCKEKDSLSKCEKDIENALSELAQNPREKIN